MKTLTCILAGLCLTWLAAGGPVWAAGEDPAPCLGWAPAPGESPEAHKELKIAAGGEFCLELASNPTTGYSWQLARPLDAGLVELSGSDYEQEAAKKGLAGTGGRERWTFKALAPGQTIIELAYRRPWEKDQPPARRLTVSVSIGP